MPRLKWNVAKLLHEGTEIQYDRPIFAGDVLTSKSQLKSITMREGRSGVRTIYTMEFAYYDQAGKRVCALLMRTSEGQ
jgi:acyl dehydratase